MFRGEGLRGAAGGGDDGEIRAAGKGVDGDRCDAGGERDPPERAAALKGGLRDFGDAVRQDDIGQPGAAKECIPLDGGDARGNGDRDGVLVALGDGECALPGVVFKGFEGELRISRIGEGVADVREHIGGQAVGAAAAHGGAAVEGEDIDAGDIVVKVDLPERRAPVKGMGIDPDDALGNHNLRKRCAMLKGIAADAGHAVRDHDPRQRRAVPERTITDGGDGITAQRRRQGQIGSAAGVCGDFCFAAADGVGKIILGKSAGRKADHGQHEQQNQQSLHHNRLRNSLSVIIIASQSRTYKAVSCGMVAAAGKMWYSECRDHQAKGLESCPVCSIRTSLRRLASLSETSKRRSANLRLFWAWSRRNAWTAADTR